MAYTYADYVTRLDALVQDSKNKAGDSQKEQALARAVEIFDNDSPFIALAYITADGSHSVDYNILTEITALWIYGLSYVKTIEYPMNQKPREYLIEEDDFWVIDDGTALDGSQLILRFASTPTEPFLVHYRSQRKLANVLGEPQNYPHTQFNFNAITTLAAHVLCMMLANAYATQIDTRITADSVNTVNISQKFQNLADEFKKAYNRLVFGEEEPTKTISGANRDVVVSVPTSAGGRQLFH